jgi:hypothetical protein
MKNIYKINQHIYITSDEEIKEGDWVISIEGIWKNTITKIVGEPITDVWKKIILTTDQDLIKDGVQAIDDEFLEWFVKNPSCESIEVEHTYISRELNKPTSKYYKIILPKEEPKQETLEEAMRNNGYHDQISDALWREGVHFGAKWQQEQNKNKFSEEELMESFIEGYKQRAEKSNLIFDNASRMYAIALFKKSKNKQYGKTKII